MDNTWVPLGAVRISGPRPSPGQLIPHGRTVWKVTGVEDLPLNDSDRDAWLQQGMPDLDTWHRHPYKIAVEWVGGALPTGLRDAGHKNALLAVHAHHKRPTWWHYPTGRWPKCSCCDEPMPCRAELEDRQITAALNRVHKLETIPKGACWACHEPITPRQDFVLYPGENLDLPGGQEPRFHTRDRCSASARHYEERWVAGDPRRERILTWPACGGILVEHADGTSECVSGRSPLGNWCESLPNCRGHETHDHTVTRACYVGENYFGARPEDGSCPRGCPTDPEQRKGLNRRPRRRRPADEGQQTIT